LLKYFHFGEKIEAPTGLKSAALHTSAAERCAEEAEREVFLYKKLSYLRSNTGNVYDAYINRITPVGFYVFLEKLLMTGFVDIASLPGRRWFTDSDSVALYGRGGLSYKLGDPVQVIWMRTDQDRLEAEFAPAYESNDNREDVPSKAFKIRRKQRKRK